MEALKKALMEAENAGAIVQGSPMEELATFMGSLNPVVQGRVHAMRGLQSQYDDLHEQYMQEMRALVEKYDKMYRPLLERRNDIVKGTAEPSADEISTGVRQYLQDQSGATDESEIKDEDVQQEVAKLTSDESVTGVPHFWLRALKNHSLVGSAVEEADVPALEHLRDIRVVCTVEDVGEHEHGEDEHEHDHEHEGGCCAPHYGDNAMRKEICIEMEFDENDYFSNTVLSKTYVLIEEEESMLESSKGTEIEWKEGKKLTTKVVTKKQRRKGKKGGAQVRTVEKEVPCDSFFNFFSPPTITEEMRAGLDEDDGDYEEEMLQELAEEDYELGMAIAQKIVPNAVEFYTGERASLMYDDDDDVDFDSEDDSDDSDDDHAPKGKGGKGKKGKGGGGAMPGVNADGTIDGAEKPECKQQ